MKVTALRHITVELFTVKVGLKSVTTPTGAIRLCDLLGQSPTTYPEFSTFNQYSRHVCFGKDGLVVGLL